MFKKFKDSNKGLRILWKYLSVYRSELTFLSVLGVFSAIANGSVPYVMGKFLDAIVNSNIVFIGTWYEMPQWTLFLSIWGLVQLVAISTDWINDRMAREISTKIYINYFIGAQTILSKLPLAFHKNAKPGEISSALNRAAQGLDSISDNIVIHLAPQFLSIIIGLGFAFVMNTSLAIVLLVGILVYVVVLFRMVPQAVPLQRMTQKAWGKSFAEMSQASSNIMSVKQFGSEEYHRKKVSQKFNQTLKLSTAIQMIWSNVGFF